MFSEKKEGEKETKKEEKGRKSMKRVLFWKERTKEETKKEWKRTMKRVFFWKKERTNLKILPQWRFLNGIPNWINFSTQVILLKTWEQRKFLSFLCTFSCLSFRFFSFLCFPSFFLFFNSFSFFFTVFLLLFLSFVTLFLPFGYLNGTLSALQYFIISSNTFVQLGYSFDSK